MILLCSLDNMISIRTVNLEIKVKSQDKKTGTTTQLIKAVHTLYGYRRDRFQDNVIGEPATGDIPDRSKPDEMLGTVDQIREFDGTGRTVNYTVRIDSVSVKWAFPEVPGR